MVNLKSYISDILDSGARVHYVLPIPEIGWDVTKRRIKSLRLEVDLLHPLQRGYYDSTTLSRFGRFAGDFSSDNFSVVDTEKIFCDEAVCFSERNGVLLYSDDDHPSFHPSLLIADEIIRSID